MEYFKNGKGSDKQELLNYFRWQKFVEYFKINRKFKFRNICKKEKKVNRLLKTSNAENIAKLYLEYDFSEKVLCKEKKEASFAHLCLLFIQKRFKNITSHDIH